jgi:predicted small metal-binding protein
MDQKKGNSSYNFMPDSMPDRNDIAEWNKQDSMTGEEIGFAQELAGIDSGYRAKQDGGRIQGLASFSCKDIGIDCPFEAHAVHDHQLMRKFIDHAESAHNMHVLSADFIFKVKNAIKK